MIQLTRHGMVFSGSVTDLRALRAQFQRDHYLILPKLIEPELFQTILRRVEAAPFQQVEFDGITCQSIMNDPITYNLLVFLLSVPEFQRTVQRITGCRRVADFDGRVYRMSPRTDDRILWHTDAWNHRMIALSLNLTTQAYQGGALQIRDRGSEEILHEVRNTGLGDALLMRISNKLCHRVLPVQGNVPRTAVAGWFRWEKVDYHARLRAAPQISASVQEHNAADLTASATRRQ